MADSTTQRSGLGLFDPDLDVAILQSAAAFAVSPARREIQDPQSTRLLGHFVIVGRKVHVGRSHHQKAVILIPDLDDADLMRVVR